MGADLRLGLTLPNRMVVVGMGDIGDILSLGVEAERSGAFRSIWVGDSLFAKRRPESVVLLSALAGRTERVRLGVGCMASFTLRDPFLLASQWATLDRIAGPGRLILAACLGGSLAGGDWRMEEEALGIPQKERLGRLREGMEVLRALWTQERASYQGAYYRFRDVVSEPRPVTSPHPPLWIASNPKPRNGDVGVVENALRRVARTADGWMTTMLSPEQFADRLQRIRKALRDEGKDPERFGNVLYYNVNVQDDRAAAFDESKRFLNLYYEREWPDETVDLWVAYGSPGEIVEKLQAFFQAGAQEITLRITAFDQKAQLRRLLNEVIPSLASVASYRRSLGRPAGLECGGRLERSGILEAGDHHR